MKRRAKISVFFVLALFMFLSKPLIAQDRVHIWIKAFIPINHPNHPGYVTKLPGSPKKYIFKEPLGLVCHENTLNVDMLFFPN